MSPAPAVVSTWLGGLDGATWRGERDDEPHLAASTMKLPLAIAACRAHEQGRLDLDTPVAIRDDLASAAPGARYHPRRVDDQEDRTWSEVGRARPLRARTAARTWRDLAQRTVRPLRCP